MDVHVDDQLWARISPTGDSGGILCITCMARRCEALGLTSVQMLITSGPFHFHVTGRTEFSQWAREYGLNHEVSDMEWGIAQDAWRVALIKAKAEIVRQRTK